MQHSEQSVGRADPANQPIEREVLKKNEYKLVERVLTDSGQYVVKTFSGHSSENCERNARHTYDALELLKERFADVLTSPGPTLLASCSVTMEYLQNLPQAQRLAPETLPLASPFFRRCYEIEVDEAVVWSIRDSVHATPKILELLSSGFPQRLGFKGDLYENLRVDNNGLVIADSETASLEPLGLSELILYVYLLAESLSHRQLRLRSPRLVNPVAFSLLDGQQCKALIHAALEFCSEGMGTLPAVLRATKLRRAERALELMLPSA